MKKNSSWRGIPSYDPNDNERWKTVKREVNGKEIDVIFRKGNPGLTSLPMSIRTSSVSRMSP